MHKDRAALEQLARKPEAASQPPSILVHLGKYLAQAGAWPAAVEVLEQAQRRHPGDYWVNYALAMSLAEQKPPRTAQAVGFFRAALAIRPQSRIAHFSLARQLLLQEQTAEAQTHFRRADELAGPHDPGSWQLLAVLSTDYLQQGEFPGALAHLRMAEALLAANDPGRARLAEVIGMAEEMLQLEKKLPAVVGGEVQPANDREKLLLAQLAQLPNKRFYATSARLYGEAFAAQPRLVEDMQAMNRYNAACSAALAGTGQGEDAAKLDARARAEWRKRALDWLRADLTFWTKVAQGAQPEAKAAARQALEKWRTDPDLAGIRDPAELGNLPADEQEAFQRLWAEVEALLKGSSGPGKPGGDGRPTGRPRGS
jgi:serine/threonine-protein kinase